MRTVLGTEMQTPTLTSSAPSYPLSVVLNPLTALPFALLSSVLGAELSTPALPFA